MSCLRLTGCPKSFIIIIIIIIIIIKLHATINYIAKSQVKTNNPQFAIPRFEDFQKKYTLEYPA